MAHPVVAAVQMTSVADVAANLAAARRLLALAREGGACLAVLPENFCFMGRNEAERRAIVERDGDGPIQQAVAAMAREFGLWVVAGTQPLALDGDSRPANACVVYDAAGKRAARYDKIHLFDVDLPGGREGYRESANAAPGAKPVTVDTPAGKLGLTVCYDLRFPELFRRLVSEGADIFSVPSAFTGPTGRAHWDDIRPGQGARSDVYHVIHERRATPPGTNIARSLRVTREPWRDFVVRLAHGPGHGASAHALSRQGSRVTRSMRDSSRDST